MAAFLGGFHLGQKPNSPDVTGLIGHSYETAAAAGRRLVAVLGGKLPDQDSTRSD